MKHDWQKICDGFAKELKQFLETNGYEKFSLCTNVQVINPNVDFLICFLRRFNIPLESENISEDCVLSFYNYDFLFNRNDIATICPISRNELFIKNCQRTEYLLSTIHPLSWAFESDIVEMSKVIEFEYISDNSYPENLTADQLEWVEMQDIDYKIITGETDPSKNPRWLGYTADQRELVAKIYSICMENKNNFQSRIQLDSSKFKQ